MQHENRTAATASFCENCFSNVELKKIINTQGTLSEKCYICGATETHCLSVENDVLRNTLRALIRVYYSEYEYNGHLGGDALSAILFGRNHIFEMPTTANQEEFESAICCIEDGWYPDTDEEVSLGGGYWDGNVLLSLSNYQHPKVYKLAERALIMNGHDLLSEAKSLFDDVSDLVSEKIDTGSTWYRARLGIKARYQSAVGSFRGYYAYSAFSPKDIGAPPPHLATEGRLNRHRISVLYLASDEITAISEIRPHPGHIVSVGEFHPKKEIRIANLATPRIADHAKDRLLDLLHIAISLGAFADLPVTPETKHWYMSTQLIGDAARESGFDGIMFQSTVSKGTNLAVFDPSLFHEASHVRPVEVKALTYETKALLDASTIDPEDYEQDSDTFLFHEMLNRRNA